MRFAEYYSQLCDMINLPEYNVRRYNKLFNYLYSTPFKWTVKNDVNRALDGIKLRNDIIRDARTSDELGPCRVLEMLIALASRCENDIMQEKSQGDRTGIWFWTMIENLGLADMTDYHYDDQYVQLTVSRFLDRRYSRNGEGSIFFINHRTEDMRRVELWYQMCWFLTEQYDFAI